MKATDPAGTGDLAVGIEARHGSAIRVLDDPIDLGLDAGVAEHPPAGDTVEREDAKGRSGIQGGKRVLTRGISRLENTSGVPLPEPGEASLRNLGNAH